MEPRIVSKSFLLVGVEAPIDLSEPFGDTINALWAELARRAHEIPDRTEPASFVGFWNMKLPDDHTTWYLAAAEVGKAGEVPAGMVSRALPPTCFAAFREAQRGQVAGPGGYAYREWMPGSAYEFDDRVSGDLELYAAPPPGPYIPCDILIPVRERRK